MKTTTHQSLVLSLLIVSALAPHRLAFAQGSLTPPGAPAPMFKTLEQVQPRIPIGTNTTPGTSNALFVISQPGSYYLTTNITGVAGKHGIVIAASGVTLDLMGFELVGQTEAFHYGITTAPSLPASPATNTFRNIVIRNGTVRKWATGILAPNAVNSQYQDLRASENELTGLSAGNDSIIARCAARDNGGFGIFALPGSVITGCTSSHNNSGISAYDAVTILACTVRSNTFGIEVQSICTINGCSVAFSAVDGITVLDSSTITACTSIDNGNVGIRAHGTCTISGCTANGNGASGIDVIQNSRVVDNICVGNATSGNIGSAGISAKGLNGKNRIENNHVVDNVTAGIYVNQPRNLIMRNSASGNGTNYVIVSGNRVGPIVVPPTSPDISGSIGGAGVGTTDPWANFSF